MAQFADPHLKSTLQAVMDPAAGDGERSSREAANLRRITDLYTQIAGEDWDALEGALTDDVEMEIVGPPGSPWQGIVRGPEAVVRQIRDNFSMVEEQTPQIVSIGTDGDTVTVAGREEGIVRATGERYGMNWVQQFTFRDDRIARFHEVLDPVPAASAEKAPDAC